MQKSKAGIYFVYEDGRPCGDDFWVFEREDAARHRLEASKQFCRLTGGTLQLLFIRSMTQNGAANAAFRGEGEILASFEVTAKESDEFSAYFDSEKVKHDINLCRELIASARIPVEEGAVPELAIPEGSDLRGELWHLDRYIEDLLHNGTITRREFDRYEEQKETRLIGFSRLPHLMNVSP